MKASLILMMVGAWCVGAVAPVRGDTVHDGRGSFGDVEISGFRGDQLTFRMSDGRTLTRKATDVRYVRVSDPLDGAAATLTDAEGFRDTKRYAQAIPLYVQVQTTARAPWISDFATMRLAQAHDRLGQFPEALEAYLALVRRQPEVARSVVPRSLPKKGTPAAEAALEAIRAAEARETAPEIRTVLDELRKRIERGEGRGVEAEADGGGAGREGGPPISSRPAAGPPAPVKRPKTADDAGARHGRTSERAGERAGEGGRLGGGTSGDSSRKAKPASATDTVGMVRKAIADNDLSLASRLYENGAAAAKASDRPTWLLLAAELGCAQKHFPEAGLNAMQVVIGYPRSPEVGAALYWAARAYEGIGRPPRALGLYRECLADKRTDAGTRKLAEERVKALEKAAGGS